MGSIQEYFSDAEPSSTPGKLWLSKLQETGALIGNTDEFTNTLANGLAPNSILFGVFQSISGYGGHYPCRLEAVRREYRKIDNGMVYQKNWPFTRLFNHHLLILKERGILVQIQNVHMDYKEEDCGLRQPRVIGLVNVASLGLVWIFGIIFALLTFIIENLLHHHRDVRE